MTRTIVTIAFCVKKILIIQCDSATVSLEHITEQSCAHHFAQSFNHSLSLRKKKGVGTNLQIPSESEDCN